MIALLKKDHADVKKLFKQFETTKASKDKNSLAHEICKMLTIHATCEEELVYPVAHEAFEGDDVELVNEALIEHATAKNLIAQIESMDTTDEMFESTVKVLSEYINHHVEEEEGEMFPKLKKCGVDLAELGKAVASRKEDLAKRSSGPKKSSAPKAAPATSGAGQRRKTASGDRSKASS